MADKVTMKVDGLKELAMAIKELNLDIDQETRRALFAGAREVKDRAQSLVPVLSVPTETRKAGTLKARIRVIRLRDLKNGWHTAYVKVKRLKGSQISKFKRSTGKLARENPDDPFYWYFVEFGTKRSKAQPFLRPAFDQTKEQALERIKLSLANRIKRVKKARVSP